MPHAVHVKPISKDIRCEVLYQNTPTFANEDLSALIRIRHTGTPIVRPPVVENPSDTITTNNDDHNEEDGWFGRRLSVSLSNSARIFFQDSESTTTSNNTTPTQPKVKPTNLLSGYVQLSGWIHYDPSVISDEKLQEFKQRTKVSGKFGGLDGMQVSQHEKDSSVYGLISKGMNGIFSTKMNDLHEKFTGTSLEDGMANSGFTESVPFFSSTQSLLFGELSMNPGDLKQFVFGTKLPLFLPSSFEGASIAIRYQLIVGMYVDSHGSSVSGPPTPKIHKFPLNINCVFDTDGYQPVSKIDQFFLLNSDPQVSEIQGQKERRRSSIAAFKKRFLSGEELTSEFKKTEILKRIKLLAEVDDKDDLNYDFLNELETLLNLDSRQSISRFIEKIQSITVFPSTENLQEEEKPLSKVIDGVEFSSVVKSLTTAPQKKYQLSHNSNPIVSLAFNKPIYKTSETIKLQINFICPDAVIRPLGLLITLDSLELINPKYSNDATSTSKNPPKVTHFKRNINLTQSTNAYSLEIPIPPSTSTHSFKTNIFENKWSLGVKLIIAGNSSNSTGIKNDEDNDLESLVFEDQVGKFLSAAPTVTGWEFGVVRVPITVLPWDGGNIGQSSVTLA
ncbi:hypothetical protein WICPIJ_009447 [Wickerhamomyces pijperi]|uniref:Rgp1-domain-containing protein n=1 Tax=Wickerhamomyces pijperi TaxID=599730 RepID=A0A9P8PNT4_WICPI|nr:hypothetical protein WICPIJ_009447 [Wickerhamomyces pijperi]